MKELKRNRLTVTPEQRDSEIHLSWVGKSSGREPGKYIGPMLDEVLDLAATEGLSVVMDFTELAYMNSSTITPVVQMLHTARERGIAVTLNYNGALEWQEVSFNALTFFESEDPPIRILGI